MSETNPKESKRYPELQRFATREEANSAVLAWKKQLMKMPRFWLGLVGYTIGVGVFITAILVMIRPWVFVPGRMYGGIVGGITGVTGFFVITWFWRHRLRLFLRQQLVDRGIPVCLKCGYDLRGQIDPRCPECGTPFDAALIEGNKDRNASAP